LKYPVGPVVPKGASGFAPKASAAIVGEPDYAALARGEPGFTVPGADLQDTPPLGPPSAASGMYSLMIRSGDMPRLTCKIFAR